MVLGFRSKGPFDSTPDLNRTFYLYGTFDLEDSAGALVPNLTLTYGRTTTNITIVGCDLYSYNHTVEVSRTTRLALDGQIPPLRESSTLSVWQPQDAVEPEDLDILDLVSRRLCYTVEVCPMSCSGAQAYKASIRPAITMEEATGWDSWRSTFLRHIIFLLQYIDDAHTDTSSPVWTST